MCSWRVLSTHDVPTRKGQPCRCCHVVGADCQLNGHGGSTTNTSDRMECCCCSSEVMTRLEHIRVTLLCCKFSHTLVAFRRFCFEKIPAHACITWACVLQQEEQHPSDPSPPLTPLPLGRLPYFVWIYVYSVRGNQWAAVRTTRRHLQRVVMSLSYSRRQEAGISAETAR